MSSPFSKPAYLEKFGLKEAPYTTNPDERYLYLTDNHKEAINTCGHIITNRTGAGLIIGEHGTGKTTLMRRIASLMRSDQNFRVAVIETAEHSPTIFQLTKEILDSFEAPCHGRDTKSRVESLKKFLLESFRNQQTLVLLIDEAQEIPARLLESLRGFLNFEDPRHGKMLQIILFAMPKINKRLPYAPSFRNRLVTTTLHKMNRQDIENMLRWRFTQAGSKAPFPFEIDAMNRLFEISKGNPRTVCGIAQLALEVSAARNEPITPTVVEEVSKRRYV